MVVIQFKKIKVVDYVNNCYSMDTYGICYGRKVTSINGMDMWSMRFNHQNTKKVLVDQRN